MTAILLSVTMVEFINTIAVDESSVVGTDTHYVSMTFVKTSGGMFGNDMWRSKEYIENYLKDDTISKRKNFCMERCPKSGMRLLSTGSY